MSAFGRLEGLPVHLVTALDQTRSVQVRFPRSRKVRIRKKWRKDRRNYKTVEGPAYCQVGAGMIVVNTRGLRELKERFGQ